MSQAQYQIERRAANVCAVHRGVWLRLTRPGWRGHADFLWGPTIVSAPATVSLRARDHLAAQSAPLLEELAFLRERLLELFTAAKPDDLLIGFSGERACLELIRHRTLPSGHITRGYARFEALDDGLFDRAALSAHLRQSGVAADPDWSALEGIARRVAGAVDRFLPLHADF